MNAVERLIRYVKYETTSDENSGEHPSSPGQMAFAEELAEEMRKCGISDVRLSESGCLFGCLPATAGREGLAPMGFLAHLDTSAEASGKNVCPQIVRNYDGGVLPLGASGKELSPERFPALKHLAGHTLITTDGTTLLGADDKSGIAEIMTAAERMIAEKIPLRPMRRLEREPGSSIFPSSERRSLIRSTADVPERLNIRTSTQLPPR